MIKDDVDLVQSLVIKADVELSLGSQLQSLTHKWKVMFSSERQSIRNKVRIFALNSKLIEGLEIVREMSESDDLTVTLEWHVFFNYV